MEDSRHARASPPPSGPAQSGVLFRVFLARLFENEATAGPADLRESFFWLVAALGAPCVLFAFHQQFYWNFIALGAGGAAKLRVDVLFDKTLYLTFTSVAVGIVSVAVWNALTIDRRDAFILGVMPVRRGAIVAAKLLSLLAYVSALNLGMHAAASLVFGTSLGEARGPAAVGRGIAAHLLAASAAGLFVFLSVVALVSACLAIFGPRRFARAAAPLQVLLVAAITTTLLLTLPLSRGAVSLAHAPSQASWLTYMPPIWFLGLYETLAGTASAPMRDLARTGALALAAAAAAVGVLYPAGCWRVLASAVAAGGPATRPWTRRASSMMVERLAAQPDTRAALQFLIATAGRVSRFRLVLSGAVGLGLTLVAPMVLYWIARPLPRGPSVSLLAAPLLLTIPLVAGMRAVIAMPSELPARWVFRSTPLAGLAGRAAARRFMCAVGILVPVAMAGAVWAALWGIGVALPLVANAVLAGGILVEALLWGFAGIPCTRPMAVSESNLQGRWPYYSMGLVAYALGIPILEVLTSGHGSRWLITAGLAGVYCLVRILSNEAARINVVTDDQRGPILLDLYMLPRAPAGGRPAAPALGDRGPRSGIPRA